MIVSLIHEALGSLSVDEADELFTARWTLSGWLAVGNPITYIYFIFKTLMV